MTIKHWKTVITNPDGKRVAHYATTTDEAIARDLAVGPNRSLIHIGRGVLQQTPEFTSDKNHIALATGAFEQFKKPGGHYPSTSISKVESVPEGPQSTDVGGDARGFIVPIWKEPVS